MLSLFILPLFAEAAHSTELPAHTGDSRIDWLNMLGWLLMIIVNGGIALGLSKRKPPVNEDITLIKAGMESERNRLNEVKARLIKMEGLTEAVSSLRAAIENRTLIESHIAERVNSIEKRIEKDLEDIKERLGHGDGIFETRTREIADMRENVASTKATVEGIKLNMLTMQTQVQRLVEAERSWRT